jgi:hypothetical protein
MRGEMSNDDPDDTPVERPFAPSTTWTDFARDAFLAIFVAAIHANGVWGVFVFDDRGAIVDNASIRDLSDWVSIFFGATQATVVDRPLLNLSLAINRAWGGADPFGYHVVNILIHAINAVLVARLARFLFSAEASPDWLRSGAGVWGTLTGALWGVHPLGTGAVVYVVQRAESIMALFFLTALLLLGRSTRSPRPSNWRRAALVAFVMSLATKEVAVAFAPLAVAFDRFFLAKDWRGLWRRRGRLHVATFVIVFLYAVRTLFFSGGRAGTAGLGTGVPVGEYFVSQFVFVTDYLRLALVPVGQAFDWGMVTITDPRRWGPRLAILLALAAATVWGTLRGQRWAFAGWWFFGLLGPTSSIIPLATQVAAEHRMYLPLAGVVCLVVVGLRFLVARRWPGVAIGLACCAIVLLGGLTVRRNSLYAAPLELWMDAAHNRPENPRAISNVVLHLRQANRQEEALVWVNKALEIPSVKATAATGLNRSTAYTTWLNDRGVIQWNLGRVDQALADFDAVVAANPDLPEARLNRAELLLELSRPEAALADCDALISRRQHLSKAFELGGRACLKLNRLEGAEKAAQAIEGLGKPLPADFARELREARAAASR